MENKINIKINDFGPINKADIDLNKLMLLVVIMQPVNQQPVNYYIAF